MMDGVLRRFLERQAGPAMEPPSGPPLTEADLKAGLLREVDLFSGLTTAELKQISQTLPMQTCQVGGLITSPDDEEERLYIVKRGRVRLYRLTPDGKQLTLEILDKGRTMGPTCRAPAPALQRPPPRRRAGIRFRHSMSRSRRPSGPS